jgi:hypothetical protein
MKVLPPDRLTTRTGKRTILGNRAVHRSTIGGPGILPRRSARRAGGVSEGGSGASRRQGESWKWRTSVTTTRNGPATRVLISGGGATGSAGEHVARSPGSIGNSGRTVVAAAGGYHRPAQPQPRGRTSNGRHPAEESPCPHSIASPAAPPTSYSALRGERAAAEQRLDVHRDVADGDRLDVLPRQADARRADRHVHRLGRRGWGRKLDRGRRSGLIYPHLVAHPSVDVSASHPFCRAGVEQREALHRVAFHRNKPRGVVIGHDRRGQSVVSGSHAVERRAVKTDEPGAGSSERRLRPT